MSASRFRNLRNIRNPGNPEADIENRCLSPYIRACCDPGAVCVPVSNYVYAWEYPINGGTTAFHCPELAFASMP